MNKIKLTGKQKFMGLDIPVVLGGFGENKKCVSDRTIGEIHGIEIKHIRELINRNLKRFESGRDVFDLKVVVQNDDNLLFALGYTQMQISKAEHIYILSERGYAKLIKIMDTDLAWKIHDKLIDEYFELRETKTKQLTPMELMELQFQALKEVDGKVDSVDRDLQQFKQDMPILGIEESRITAAVRKKGVGCLGGKDSDAYHDRSLRSKVYADIYAQLKREFGVDTYKAIKRNQSDIAVKVVESYELPIILAEQIEDVNSQLGFDDLLN